MRGDLVFGVNTLWVFGIYYCLVILGDLRYSEFMVYVFGYVLTCWMQVKQVQVWFIMYHIMLCLGDVWELLTPDLVSDPCCLSL